MPDFNPDEYLQEKTAQSAPAEFDPDKYLTQKTKPNYDLMSLPQRALSSALRPVAKVVNAVDSVTGAPIRSAVGALQEGKGFGEALSSAKNQFLADPSKAPSGKDIASKLGLSAEENINTGLYLNPFKNETLHLSPAGIAGGVIEAATDPLTYVSGVPVEAIGEGAVKQAAKILPAVGESLGASAERRALKAAVGQNQPLLKELAQIPTGGTPNLPGVQARMQTAGRYLLDKDLVPMFGDSKSIGKRSVEALEDTKNKFSAIESGIDESFPNSVDPKGIAKNIMSYAEENVPNTPQGRRLHDQLLETAAQYESSPPLSFKDANFEKQQYKYKPMSSDALISNDDMSRMIRGSIGSAMDESAARSSMAPAYAEAKKDYQNLKPLAKAATTRDVRDFSNRMVSPSDHGVGGAVMTAAAAAGHGLTPSAVIGAIAGAANKVVRERGNAFSARILDNVSRVMKSPEMVQKYGSRIVDAAKRSPAALIALHTELANNDPNYRAMSVNNFGSEESP